MHSEFQVYDKLGNFCLLETKDWKIHQDKLSLFIKIIKHIAELTSTAITKFETNIMVNFQNRALLSDTIRLTWMISSD